MIVIFLAVGPPCVQCLCHVLKAFAKRFHATWLSLALFSWFQFNMNVFKKFSNCFFELYTWGLIEQWKIVSKHLLKVTKCVKSFPNVTKLKTFSYHFKNVFIRFISCIGFSADRLYCTMENVFSRYLNVFQVQGNPNVNNYIFWSFFITGQNFDSTSMNFTH